MFVTISVVGGEKTFAEMGQECASFAEFKSFVELAREQASMVFVSMSEVDSLDVLVTASHGTMHLVATRHHITGLAELIPV